MRTAVSQFRTPDLRRYKLAEEHPIRCPKCRAGANCISSTWLRGKVELKCICGWMWEIFVTVKEKASKMRTPAEAQGSQGNHKDTSRPRVSASQREKGI